MSSAMFWLAKTWQRDALREAREERERLRRLSREEEARLGYATDRAIAGGAARQGRGPR